LLLLLLINTLYVFGAPLLSPCIPASLPSSLPPGSASPSPTRWPSLRVKAVFPAPLARQNVAVAEPVRTDRRQSRHTGEKHVHTRGKIFFLLRQSDFGYPGGYPATAPTYTPNLYQTGSPGYPPGYTSAGTPYKVPPTQSNGAPPPYTPTPTPYPTAMYPIRSAYPQQNIYAQGAYYTQPVYAAQPHVIHHTTVVQPNSIPSTALYPAPVPVPAPRNNGMAAMGMVAGTTMAMSAGTLLTTPQHPQIGGHPVTVPTYRPQGTPGYSYVPPHW
uniref:Family with sequence similarity 168 member A n=1 Tax=Sparus aurata TaxID=8175 RepID=A0A671TG59_SPAAU